MTNKGSHIQSLFLKYTAGTASLEEVKEVLALVAEGSHDAEITAFMQEQMAAEEPKADLDVERWGVVLNKIKKQTVHERKIKLWPRIAVAAAAVATITLGIWLYYTPSSRQSVATRDLYANDIAPGKNTATLTFANGKTITLSDAKTGVVIDASSLKYNDGTVISDAIPSSRTEGRALSNGKDPSVVGMTSVSTPRGGTYQVILPDGSLVVLNAASSIKFPATFSGQQDRKVELQGEGYFEIFKDKKHPFVVKSKNQDVIVLGTHFNISGYEDEAAVKTTLLEGSVRVSSRLASPSSRTNVRDLSSGRKDLSIGRDDVVLKPGQQSSLSSDKLKVAEVDVNEVVAWKNSYFRFTDERIDVIMAKLARWYDIEVIYEGDIPNESFNAAISRNKNISQVLNVLAKTNAVRFRISGKKVTVSK